MNVVKKIDDIGRITIPKDFRRSLRWMEGDEIEIVLNADGSILLRKHEDNAVNQLETLRAQWSEDSEIEQKFLELINLVKEKN